VRAGRLSEAVNREMERYSREAVNVGYIDLNPVLLTAGVMFGRTCFCPTDFTSVRSQPHT